MYRQTHSLGELVVTFIVRWYTHDRACTVAFQYEVGDPDWYTLAIQRVQRIGSSEDSRHSTLITRAQAIDRSLVSRYADTLGRGCDGIDKGVMRSQGYESHPEDSIQPCRIDLHSLLRYIFNCHAELQPRGATNPVALERLDALGPVELIQVIQELLGIAGYFQKPLLQPASLYERTTAFTMTIDHLLVGQHGLIFRAPVYGRGLALCQPGLKQLQENPLRPAIIAGISRIQLVRPIEAVANTLQLPLTKALNVARREGARVDTTLNSEVFAMDAECIKTHRLKHIVALHRHPAAMYIRTNIGVHVANMQALC